MPNFKRKHQAGFSLLETMFACLILAICSVGILALFTISVVKNANGGDDATRTTEYAQDKMEQLMSLQFQDTTSNTIVHFDGTNYNAPCMNYSMTLTCTGTGLTTPGGDITTNVSGYSDYVSQNTTDGTWVSSDSATNASFVRRWQIAWDSTGTIKVISVRVISLNALAVGSTLKGGTQDGIAPSTTLISQKTNVADTYTGKTDPN